MFAALYDNEDMSKTYDYGCYCGNLGDRPSTGVLTGRLTKSPVKCGKVSPSGLVPVDEKDKHCLDYTRCHRCVKFDFGHSCTPDQRKYNVG